MADKWKKEYDSLLDLIKEINSNKNEDKNPKYNGQYLQLPSPFTYENIITYNKRRDNFNKNNINAMNDKYYKKIISIFKYNFFVRGLVKKIIFICRGREPKKLIYFSII